MKKDITNEIGWIVIKDGVIDLKRLRYVMEMFDLPIDIEEIKKYYTIK